MLRRFEGAVLGRTDGGTDHTLTDALTAGVPANFIGVLKNMDGSDLGNVQIKAWYEVLRLANLGATVEKARALKAKMMKP